MHAGVQKTHLAVVPRGPDLPGTCTSVGGLRMSSQTWSMCRNSNFLRRCCLLGFLPCLWLVPTARLPGGMVAGIQWGQEQLWLASSK